MRNSRVLWYNHRLDWFWLSDGYLSKGTLHIDRGTEFARQILTPISMIFLCQIAIAPFPSLFQICCMHPGGGGYLVSKKSLNNSWHCLGGALSFKNSKITVYHFFRANVYLSQLLYMILCCTSDPQISKEVPTAMTIDWHERGFQIWITQSGCSFIARICNKTKHINMSKHFFRGLSY